MNGNEAILYWNNEPIACLTSNGISEVLSFLTTSKKTARGAQTFKPVANSYSINFEAVMINGMAMSWQDLSLLCRNMRVGTWEIMDDAGRGYLSNLELTANTGENIIFTGTIVGIGVIINADTVYHVWAQAPGIYVDNATKYVFVDN